MKKRKNQRTPKSILNRHKAVNEVVAACQEWQGVTADRLAALLAPELTGEETLPDFALVQALIGRALARRWQHATEMDERNLRLRLDCSDLLAERDAAVRTLYGALALLRTLLRGVHGSAQASFVLGFSGRTSRDPVVLLRQADRAVARLRARAEPLIACGVAEVAAAAERLRTLCRDAGATAKELDGAVLDRQRALADFNRAFVDLAGWLEATYRVTRRDFQAERVRPSRQRPGLLHQVRRRRTASAGAPELPAAEGEHELWLEGNELDFDPCGTIADRERRVESKPGSDGLDEGALGGGLC